MVSVAVAVGGGGGFTPRPEEETRKTRKTRGGGNRRAQRVKTVGQFLSIVAPREVRLCGDAAEEEEELIFTA